MYHFEGHTRGNEPKIPKRDYKAERWSVYMRLLADTMAMKATDSTIKAELYDLLMMAAGELFEINQTEKLT
jgi:hypothetical protein